MARRQRQFRTLVVICAASGLAVVPEAGAAPPPVAQPCAEFAASATFARDRSAFCAGEVRDPTTRNTTAIAFFSTADGGRSWTKATAVGLVPPAGSNVLNDVIVSPRYTDDKAVYLHLTNGLWVTVDRGETFLPLDPLAWGRVTAFELAGRAMLAHALRGDADGANNSSLVDPTTRLRTPVKGSPGRDVEFAIPQGFARDGLAFVMAEHGLGLTRRFQLYSCSTALECSTPLFTFPTRWTFDRMWLAGDFAKSKTLYTSIRTLEGAITLWWSRDAGRTFSRWKAAELLDRDYTKAFGLSPVPGTRELYLRISGNGDPRPSGPPFEQLFWSRDAGASWKRVAYGRIPQQPGPRGSMTPAPPRMWMSDGSTPRGLVTATGGGRVFVLGEALDRANRYESFFCTTDNGRTWARACAR